MFDIEKIEKLNRLNSNCRIREEIKKRKESFKIQNEFRYENIFFVNFHDESDFVNSENENLFESLYYDVIFIKNTYVFFSVLQNQLSRHYLIDKIKEIVSSIYEKSNTKNNYYIKELNKSITIEQIKKIVSNNVFSKFQLTQANYIYRSATTNFYLTSNLKLRESFLDYEYFCDSYASAIDFINRYDCLKKLEEKVQELYYANENTYFIQEKIMQYSIPEFIKIINKIN